MRTKFCFISLNVSLDKKYLAVFIWDVLPFMAGFTFVFTTIVCLLVFFARKLSDTSFVISLTFEGGLSLSAAVNSTRMLESVHDL